MDSLKLNRLEADEVSINSTATDFSFVVRGKENFRNLAKEDVTEYFRENGPSIKSLVEHNGALLFRDLPLAKASEYEASLEALGYDLLDSNYGGASPRSQVTDKTFISTEAPGSFIIGLHTEFCYQTTRPRMISFFCVTPPAGYGETPIFDCSRVWSSLSTGLQSKLEKQGLLYKRYFPYKKSYLNFRKPWKEVFQTDSRDVVEAYLNSEGMTFNWDKDGGLATNLHLPAMLRHPFQNKEMISISLFNVDSLTYNLRHFRERYNPMLRMALEWFIKWEYGHEDIFLKVLLGDGIPFSRAESEEIQRASWRNAIIFKWRPGDLMILNNISFAHSRLNVKKPRLILTAMAGKYDVRDYLSVE